MERDPGGRARPSPACRYDNTGGLGASTWRHVAFIEQSSPSATGRRHACARLPEGRHAAELPHSPRTPRPARRTDGLPLADVLRRLQALHPRRLPRRLPDRRAVPHRVRHRRGAGGHLQRLRLLRPGLPVRRHRPAPGRRPGVQVHDVLRPAGRGPGAGLRQGVPDRVHPVRPARRAARAGRRAGRPAARGGRRPTPGSTATIPTTASAATARSSCCSTSPRCTACRRTRSSPPATCPRCGGTPARRHSSLAGGMAALLRAADAPCTGQVRRCTDRGTPQWRHPRAPPPQGRAADGAPGGVPLLLRPAGPQGRPPGRPATSPATSSSAAWRAPLGARRGRPADRPPDAGRRDEGVLRWPPSSLLRRRAGPRPGPPGALPPHAARVQADLADERGLLAARRLRSGGRRGGPVRGHRPAAARPAPPPPRPPRSSDRPSPPTPRCSPRTPPCRPGTARTASCRSSSSAPRPPPRPGMALVARPPPGERPRPLRRRPRPRSARSVAARAAERRLGMVRGNLPAGAGGQADARRRVLTGGGAALAALLAAVAAARRPSQAAWRCSPGRPAPASASSRPASPRPRTRPTRSCLNEPPKGCCRHTENSNAPPPLCVPGRSPVSRQSTTSSTGASARAVRSQRTVTVVRQALEHPLDRGSPRAATSSSDRDRRSRFRRLRMRPARCPGWPREPPRSCWSTPRLLPLPAAAAGGGGRDSRTPPGRGLARRDPAGGPAGPRARRRRRPDGRRVSYTDPEGGRGTLATTAWSWPSAASTSCCPSRASPSMPTASAACPRRCTCATTSPARSRLAAAAEDPARAVRPTTFVVVGAGYTGTEVAAHGVLFTDALARQNTAPAGRSTPPLAAAGRRRPGAARARRTAVAHRRPGPARSAASRSAPARPSRRRPRTAYCSTTASSSPPAR